MPTNVEHSAGDMLTHHERMDVVGQEMKVHGNNRPIVEVAETNVVDLGLSIALYSTHGGGRGTLVAVEPLGYPGENKPTIGAVDTQQIWTFPVNRLFGSVSGYLVPSDLGKVRSALDEILQPPPGEWPTKAATDGCPTIGSVVWYRVIVRENDDAEAVEIECRNAGIEKWRPKHPLPCIVLTASIKSSDGKLALATLVPLLAIEGLTGPTVAHPVGDTPLHALTSVLLTIDYDARRGWDGRFGKFMTTTDELQSWMPKQSDYIAILNDVRRHIGLKPVSVTLVSSSHG